MIELIFLAIVMIMVSYLILAYNKLVTLKNQYKNAFSQIEVQLLRRYDLIPNLVNTAKGYLKHEQETFLAVVKARDAAVSALSSANPDNKGDVTALSAAEAGLMQAMGQFNVKVEAYPELKASENMKQLSEELTSTENRVSFARQAYNDCVMDYNNHRQSFPVNLFSDLFGHKTDATLLEFENKEAIKVAPAVSF